ncbi:MAG: hypothetical protein ACXWNI_04550, partial [Candidatus Limnocylindrales bacterium]
MKIPRRLRLGSRRPDAGEALPVEPAVPERGRSDEGARILRRTRLRLMGVSGLVTLFILVALGVAAYGVVAR